MECAPLHPRAEQNCVFAPVFSQKSLDRVAAKLLPCQIFHFFPNFFCILIQLHGIKGFNFLIHKAVVEVWPSVFRYIAPLLAMYAYMLCPWGRAQRNDELLRLRNFYLTMISIPAREKESGFLWGKRVCERGGSMDDQGTMSLRFRSRSEHVLDDKGRLSIPARFRDILRQSGAEMLVVTNWHQCLKAYPAGEWERLEAKLLGEGRSQPGLADFVRYVISGVSECLLDRQGRILLLPALRMEFGIERDVVLNGMLDHFEIWDRAAWQQETRRARGNFTSYQSGLSSLGIL